MKIEVNLFASLMKYLPETNSKNPYFIEVEQGATIAKILDRLMVPPEIPKIIFVNGLLAKEKTVLKDGDRAGIFPLVAGG